MRVLFLYPNHRGNYMLPPAIGILSAVLKKEGHTVDVFDTTFYAVFHGGRRDANELKTEKLIARPAKMPENMAAITTNPFADFRNKIKEFRPDLVALSATEDLFLPGLELLQYASDSLSNVTTVIGGVFATFSPDLCIKHPEIDIVCRGEGEDALRILCERIENNQDYSDIPNLWIRNKNIPTSKKVGSGLELLVLDGENSDGIVRNTIQMVDMDKNPLIDVELFDESRFYRPMAGKVYRMFPVEIFRGCPYTCRYCNSPSQSTLYKEEAGTNFLRRKSFDRIREELEFYKYKMKAEYLYFWSDTFFSWNRKEFDEFCEIYRDISLPFWCQTRPETVRHDTYTQLKEIGCHRISFGLEHGNEKFRREVLDRRVSNDKIVECMQIVNDVGISFSLNNIVGLPGETRELAFDTIELNRKIKADDRGIYPFTPFHGIPLRKVCEDMGLLKHEDLVESLVEGPALNMPQFPRKSIEGMLRTFNMYVMFPKSRWKEIEMAEEFSSEGDKIHKKLKEEFMATYKTLEEGAL